MKKTPIEKIESFMNYLPSKDVPIGMQFLKTNNFDSLVELIDSALIKTKKNLRSGNVKQEYLDVDINKLNILKAEVDLYHFGINLLDKENFYDED